VTAGAAERPPDPLANGPRQAAGAPGPAQKSEIGVTRDEIQKVEKYLRKVFASPTISVRLRPKKDDSAEVYVGDEFVGILFKDEEDGDLSYNFNMAVLEVDLE